MTEKLITTITELVQTTSEQREEIKELKAKLTTVEAKNKSLLHLQNVIDSKVIKGKVEAVQDFEDKIKSNTTYTFLHAYEDSRAASGVMIVIEDERASGVVLDSDFFK